MQSPLKGLDRISEELRLERNKAGEALQDAARFRAEVASLRHTNDEKDSTINELTENYKLEQNETENLRATLEELENEFIAMRDSTQARDDEYQLLYNERQHQQDELDELKDLLYQRDMALQQLTTKTNALENRADGKDELINKLKREIQEVRNSHAEIEQERLNLFEELRQQQSWNEELKLELGKSDSMNEGYQQTRSSNDDLRSELNAALNANASYLEQIREMSLKIKEKTLSEGEMGEIIQDLRAEHALVLKELNDLEVTREQMSAQVSAEMDASEAAKQRAEAAARGREFLDRQLHELQEKHGQSLRHNAALEEQLTAAKTTASELYTEVSQLREKLVQSQSAVEQASGMQAMVVEMDLLRSQLNDVRRQLLRRGVEEDAGTMAPHAIAIREEQCRAMYEGIISQLRIDIEQTNTRYHETNRRCEEALRQAHQVPGLIDEIEIYKELCKNSSQENQSVALSVSEEKNRALKVGQEKSNLQHELHRAQEELVGAKAEIKRANEEVAAQRERVKMFHANKIAADKKVAECSTVNSKLETALEDAKQRADTIALELEKTKRAAHEQSFTIKDLNLKINEIENLKADSAALSKKLVNLKAEFSSKEKDLTLQVETLRHQKATVERELASTREKISIHRNGFEQSHHDLTRLRTELDTVIAERDRLKRNLADNENQQAEQHLFDLKRDLEQTVHEFNDLEKEKSAKDKIIQQISAECSKEREKVALLKLQMSTLEDRLRVANQELSVLRNLDVYHSSMQVQLQSYRNDRSYNKGAMESSASQSRYALLDSRTAERDLGSAFANSLNHLEPTQSRPLSRPSSRASNAHSVGYVEESERDLLSGPSSRSASPVFFSRTTPMNRVDLSKPSSPIIRPAPFASTLPSERYSSLSSSRALAASSASAAAKRNSDASVGKFSLHELDAHDHHSPDELDHKSVISDLGSMHEDFVRREADQYLPVSDHEASNNNNNDNYNNYSNRLDGSRNNERAPSRPASTSLPQSEVQVVSSESKSDPPSTNFAGEAERQELLRRRAERKALRDQQLRDRILREGALGNSFSAMRSGAAVAGPNETRDDASVASTGSAARADHRAPTSATYSTTFSVPPGRSSSRSRRDPAAGSASTTRDNINISLGSRRAKVPSPVSATASRNPVSARSQYAGTANFSSSRMAPSASEAPAASTLRDVPYRPAKTDFERARKLLSM